MCQEWGVLCGGTWRTLRVPDRILGWHDYPWCNGLPCLTRRIYLASFMLISLLEVWQEWGVLHGGTWRTLRVPDRRLSESKSPNIENQFTPTLKLAEKYARIDDLIVSLSKMSSTFGGGRWYQFSFNRKLTDWKGTDWQGFEPTDSSLYANCFSLREGVLKERSQALLNWVNAELVSVNGH